jgi:hypothetical protein
LVCEEHDHHVSRGAPTFCPSLASTAVPTHVLQGTYISFRLLAKYFKDHILVVVVN